MHILVDTNILLDYSFNKTYAINFFEEAAREKYELYILQDVYAEAKNLSPDFGSIKKLLQKFITLKLYHRIKTNKKLGKKTELLTEKCNIILGHDIDRTDRKLITISLRHDLHLLTKDKELQQIARSEGCKILAL